MDDLLQAEAVAATESAAAEEKQNAPVEAILLSLLPSIDYAIKHSNPIFAQNWLPKLQSISGGLHLLAAKQNPADLEYQAYLDMVDLPEEDIAGLPLKTQWQFKEHRISDLYKEISNTTKPKSTFSPHQAATTDAEKQTRLKYPIMQDEALNRNTLLHAPASDINVIKAQTHRLVNQAIKDKDDADGLAAQTTELKSVCQSLAVAMQHERDNQSHLVRIRAKAASAKYREAAMNVLSRLSEWSASGESALSIAQKLCDCGSDQAKAFRDALHTKISEIGGIPRVLIAEADQKWVDEFIERNIALERLPRTGQSCVGCPPGEFCSLNMFDDGEEACRSCTTKAIKCRIPCGVCREAQAGSGVLPASCTLDGLKSEGLCSIRDPIAAPNTNTNTNTTKPSQVVPSLGFDLAPDTSAQDYFDYHVKPLFAKKGGRRTKTQKEEKIQAVREEWRKLRRAYMDNIHIDKLYDASELVRAAAKDDGHPPLKYCPCFKPEDNDRMIACDNENCPVEWYHYECVGITGEPEEEMWFCQRCDLFKTA